MPKSISVVIPSLGREAELIHTVGLLLGQSRVPDEIVVVDQNQPALGEVDRYFDAHPVVKHLRSPVPGYAHNLNVGLQAARGELLLFLDDDVRFGPDLVARHLEAHESLRPRMPRLAGIAGRVFQPRGDRDPSMIRETGRFHRWSGAVVADFNGKNPGPAHIAPGGNMSILRSALIEVGGFDAGFDGNGYRAETDACLRLIRAGYELYFEPRAELEHLMAPRGGCRMPDKAEHTYYFIKNGLRLYRRHSPVMALPWLVLRSMAYVAAKAAFNRDTAILSRGLFAVARGLSEPLGIRA